VTGIFFGSAANEFISLKMLAEQVDSVFRRVLKATT